MRSHRLATTPPIVIDADVPPEIVAWLVDALATEPLVAGGSFALGAVLVRLEPEGDALRLLAPRLGGPEDPSLAEPTTTDATKAVVWAYEAARVRESLGLDTPSPGIAHVMRAMAGPTWRDRAGFVALREPALGSDSGWSIVGAHRGEVASSEISIGELLSARPMFARFATCPTGTRVDYRAGVLHVSRDERLTPRTGSWLAERLATTHLAYDPVRDAPLREALRADRSAIYRMSDRVAEERCVATSVARALLADVEHDLDAEALYQKALVRRLHGLLRDGREADAITLVERTAKRDRAFASAWVAEHRDALVANTVPARR